MKRSTVDYQSVLTALVAAVAEQVRIVVAAWRAGDLLLTEAVDLIVGFIVRAERQSAVATLVALNGLMPEEQQVRRVEFPPVDEQDEVVLKAVGTVLEDLPDDPAEEDAEAFDKRVQQLARGRVTETAGKLLDDRLKDVPDVIGYTRGTDEDPCELCTWLKKEHLRPGGYISPAGQPMHRHPGCCCVPVPVYREKEKA